MYKCSFFLCLLCSIWKAILPPFILFKPHLEWNKVITLLVYFFLSHLCFLWSWKTACLVFPLGIHSVNVLVVSKATKLKGHREVGCLTGKIWAVWKSWSSLELAEMCICMVLEGNYSGMGIIFMNGTHVIYNSNLIPADVHYLHNCILMKILQRVQWRWGSCTSNSLHANRSDEIS